MSRRVWAVLIGANTTELRDERGRMLPEIPQALAQVSALERELARRGALEPFVYVGTRATCANVKAALKAVRQESSAADLAVVMFSGHGTALPEGSGWVLRDDVFTGAELARELDTLPAGIERVVISDCCYAAGLFTPECTPRDLVIIASVRKGLGSVPQVGFVETMCQQLAGSPTYEVLGQRLQAAVAVSVVDAQPRKLLQRIAFDAVSCAAQST